MNQQKTLRLTKDESLKALYKAKFALDKQDPSQTEIEEKIRETKENYRNERDELRREKQSLHHKVGAWFYDVWFSLVWVFKLISVRFPKTMQFFVFFMISNAVTVLQLVLMPAFKAIFEQTNLINMTFQWGRIGSNFDGTPYYMFNYVKGMISEGGGGGLGYFLAIQITLAIAQVINFFLQRNITFKSNSSVVKAASWYVIAYIAITLIASAAQGLYKAPIYNLFMNVFGWGSTGEVFADVITMVIYSAISFWVFFPIFKFIFKNTPKQVEA